MKAVLIFNRNYSCTTGQYIYKELKNLGYQTEILLPQEKEKILKIKPDFVLAIDDGSHYILDINYHPKAIWIIDSHTSFICDKVMSKSFDIIFVAQKEYIERFKKYNPYVYWLPLAADPEWHGKQNLEKIYDIAFIGQLGIGWRRKLLFSLKKDFPHSFIGQADCKKIGKIYSQTKIVVNYNVNNDINMRVFEAMASGSLLITNEIKNNGFNELFQEGKHLIVYNGTYKDLKTKIEYYLKNNKERETIAFEGYKLILEKHTYKHRLDFILNKILEVNKNQVNFKDFSKIQFKIMQLNLFLNFLFWKIIYLRIWKFYEFLKALIFFK